MRGEWGKGKTPFPLIKRVVRVKGGYTQSFGGPLALFLIFHEFMSKGGAPLLRKWSSWVVGLARGCFLSGKSLSQLRKDIRNPFPTLSHDFSDFYKIWLF
jgi:hypothetical protein